MSQNEAQKEWQKWRETIEGNMKKQGDKLNSVSSQINELTESLKPAPTESHKESATFEEYLTSHIPDCPECQAVLKKAGYAKPPTEEKTEDKTEDKTEKSKRWSVSSDFE